MTPTLSILTLAWILVLAAGSLLLLVVWDAFTDSWVQGLLALFVPGYAIYYGWTRFSYARRRAIVAGALGALAVAAIAWGISAAFAPHRTMDDAAAARDMWGERAVRAT
jgi:hypothetical protein